MAEVAALGAILGGVTNAGAKLVNSRSTFVARHESSHRDQIATLDKSIKEWGKIPREETDTDDEKEFETRRGRARTKTRKYEDHLEEYRQMSGWRNPVRKSLKRYEVRSAKRESRRTVSNVREYVEDTSDKRRVSSRGSSRGSSRTSSSSQRTVLISPGTGSILTPLPIAVSPTRELAVISEPPIKIKAPKPIRAVKFIKPRLRAPPPILSETSENTSSDTLSSDTARQRNPNRTIPSLRKITIGEKTTWGWLPVVCAATSTTVQHGIRTKFGRAVFCSPCLEWAVN